MNSLVPVILSMLWNYVQTNSCDTALSLPNHKLQGHVIKTHSAQTSNECVLQRCALHADCHSINFDSRYRTCELNKANHLTNPESLVTSDGSQYLNYFLRAPLTCSNSMCSYPRVCAVDKKNGQNYKCVSCEDMDVKEVISFPRKSNEDQVVYEVPTDVQLAAFTVSMWVQVDSSTTYHTPFSYATVRQANEVSVYLTKTYTELGIANVFDTSFPPLVDGKWHHICATWQNLDGTYKLYIDGVKQGSDKVMHKGHVIQKGALILGQEQDSYKGGFDQSESLQGNLSSVNVWDRVLTAQAVSVLARKCPTEEGNFLPWSTLKTKTSSGLKLICSNQCVLI